MELIRGGSELIARVEPLWTALFDHHLEVGAAGIPTIARELTWPRRHEHYLRLFAEHPVADIRLAEWDGRVVGYAMSHTEGDGDLETMVLETLSVLPEARGRGIGTRLMDAVDRAALEAGVGRSAVDVLGGNGRARELYLGRGYLPSTESWLLVEPPADGAGLGGSAEAVPHLRELAAEIRSGWSVRPGPDDTWISGAEMVVLTCDGAIPPEPEDIERLVEATVAAGFWTVFAEIPTAPAASALRDALRGRGFRMSTERLVRIDRPGEAV